MRGYRRIEHQLNRPTAREWLYGPVHLGRQFVAITCRRIAQLQRDPDQARFHPDVLDHTGTDQVLTQVDIYYGGQRLLDLFAVYFSHYSSRFMVTLAGYITTFFARRFRCLLQVAGHSCKLGT